MTHKLLYSSQEKMQFSYFACEKTESLYIIMNKKQIEWVPATIRTETMMIFEMETQQH